MSPTADHLAGRLAERCSRDWQPGQGGAVEAEFRSIVRTAFIDTLACILAGRNEPVTARVNAWAGRASLDFPAGAAETGPAMAALLNATCGHALDFDDVGLAGHPSVVLIPVLLAEHEAHGVHGFDLVQAYAKGYAVWAELARRMKVHLHGRGWHPSAVFGTVAAAAAAAAARRLPAEQTAHALGIAASSAAGLIANFGSMTKPLQVGRAARSGIEAADLAAAGIDASPDALDGPAGLLAALAGPENADREPALMEDFEDALRRQRPGIKKYPICYAAHRIVDGVLDLRAAQGLQPDDIESIDATISRTAAGVLRHRQPQTLSEARFSLEFAVAVALVHGAVGTPQVQLPNLEDPDVRGLMERVHTATVDTRCPLEPSFAFEDSVRITTRDGRVLDSGPIRFARGHAMLPLAEAELIAKLVACADGDRRLADAALARVDAALRG
jgi:aconitate decarboxylase